MTRYEMAKLVSMAGRLSTRKRVQKVIHMLQAAGLDFGVEFRLHHYGPYSDEVAGLLTELVREDFLSEECSENFAGKQFEYTLADGVAESLREVESQPGGDRLARKFSDHKPLIDRLVVSDLSDLELASTIVFFRQKGHDWSIAKENACSFKRVQLASERAARAEQLATSVVD